MTKAVVLAWVGVTSVDYCTKKQIFVNDDRKRTKPSFTKNEFKEFAKMQQLDAKRASYYYVMLDVNSKQGRLHGCMISCNQLTTIPGNLCSIFLRHCLLLIILTIAES